MSQQQPGAFRRPRPLLWLGLTLLMLLNVLVAALAFLPYRQLFSSSQVTSSSHPAQSTAKPGGPWYLANGGSCVQLPSPPPSQASNVRVSHDTYLAHSEPEIAENPQNPLDLVGGSKFFTNPARYQFKIGYYTSTDGGCAWKDNGVLPGYERYTLTSDISFAFDLHNDVYAAVLVDGEKGNSNFSGIAVSKSTDGGQTFQPPVLAQADPTGATFSDKPWIGVDQTTGPHAGAVYVVWNLDSNTDSSIAPIYFTRSTDGGQTFSPGVEIDGASPRCQFGTPAGGAGALTCNSDLGATPVIGPDGAISVVYAYLDPNL